LLLAKNVVARSRKLSKDAFMDLGKTRTKGWPRTANLHSNVNYSNGIEVCRSMCGNCIWYDMYPSVENRHHHIPVRRHHCDEIKLSSSAPPLIPSMLRCKKYSRNSEWVLFPILLVSGLAGEGGQKIDYSQILCQNSRSQPEFANSRFSCLVICYM
jgi:hypothetical protein